MKFKRKDTREHSSSRLRNSDMNTNDSDSPRLFEERSRWYLGRGLRDFCVLITAMVLVSSVCLAIDPRYHIDGTTEEPIVTDHVTGLQWQQNTTIGSVDWKDALAHCEGLSYGGSDNWRLPDVTELISIVDEKKTDPPAINPVYFPGFDDEGGHWTSTTSRKIGTTVYVVYFGDQDSTVGLGGISAVSKTTSALVLCVRGNE